MPALGKLATRALPFLSYNTGRPKAFPSTIKIIKCDATCGRGFSSSVIVMRKHTLPLLRDVTLSEASLTSLIRAAPTPSTPAPVATLIIPLLYSGFPLGSNRTFLLHSIKFSQILGSALLDPSHPSSSLILFVEYSSRTPIPVVTSNSAHPSTTCA